MRIDQSRLRQSIFNSLPGRCAHRGGSQRPKSQTVTWFFSRNNNPVSRRSTPLTLLWDFVSQPWEERRHKRKNHSIAVVLWARPPVLSHGHKKPPHRLWRRLPPQQRSATEFLGSALLAILLPLRRSLLFVSVWVRSPFMPSTPVSRSPCRRFVSIVAVSGATSFSFAWTSVAWPLLRSSSSTFWESARSADVSPFNFGTIPVISCTTAEIAELPRSEPQDSWIAACLNFHCFDVQSWLP